MKLTCKYYTIVLSLDYNVEHGNIRGKKRKRQANTKPFGFFYFFLFFCVIIVFVVLKK